jgi:CrcB protein
MHILLHIILVFLGGSLGAAARYGLSQWVNARTLGSFPWGTFVVNITGCVMIGVVSAQASRLGGTAFLLIDVGFIGAYTTFSSLSYETLRLMGAEGWVRGLLNPLASLVLGVAAVWAGIRLGVWA